MTEPFGEPPLPDDGRLDRRRIQATVLERRAELRRRRWWIILAGVLLAAGVQIAIYAVDTGLRHSAIKSISSGTLAVLFVVLAISIGWRKLSTGKTAPNTPIQPPDFTHLGPANTFAERLEQVTDDDDH